MSLRHSGQARVVGVDVGLGLATAHQRVHGLNDEEEHRRGDRQERDQRVQEVAVEEVARVDRERQVLEVRLAEDERDDRREQVGDQRLDDGAERGADHDRDRQVDDVPAQQECLEVFEHAMRLPDGWVRAGVRRRAEVP